MILINFVLVEEVEEAEMEESNMEIEGEEGEEFDEEQVLNEVKPGDWFSVRSKSKFTRKEAILLAYVCRDQLVELAALPTGYISPYSRMICASPTIQNHCSRYYISITGR